MEKIRYIFLIILLAGCSSSVKQTVREQPVSISVNENRNRIAYPSWFLNPPDAVIGIGLASYSQFNPEKSYATAFKYAIEDLNSNNLSVVTVEQFRQGTIVQFQEEVAISDSYNESNVIKIDSAIVGDYVYYLVGIEPMSSNSGTAMIATVPPLSIPASEIINDYSSVLVHGEHERFQINPYAAWALSKQSALKRLGLFTASKVQSLQKMYNEEFENISYIKSRVALKQIKVKSRWIEEGYLHTLVEVQQSNVINLTE